MEKPSFESGLVKIQKVKSGEMRDVEKQAVSQLIISVSESPKSAVDLTLAKRALQNYMLENTEKEEFFDTRLIVPTSNACERLYSKYHFPLTDCRRAVSPLQFEAQVFLNVNRDLWTITEVTEVVS